MHGCCVKSMSTRLRVLPCALWMVTENANSNGKMGLRETSAMGTKTSPVAYLNLSGSVPPLHMVLVNGMTISSGSAMDVREMVLSLSSCLALVVLMGLSSRVFLILMLSERGGSISISVPNAGMSGPSRMDMTCRNCFLSEKVKECVRLRQLC